MKQILIIHGGNSFLSYNDYLYSLKNSPVDYERLKPGKSWRNTIVSQVTDADILMPDMPNSANAQFEEWQIMFEKILPFLKDDVRLVGHSLGAMFLAKYLHVHPLEYPVRQLILVAGGYDDDVEGYGSFAVESAKDLDGSAVEIHLFHSRDDFVVPFTELAKFESDLPTANVHEFDDRNHFLDENFPELIELLRI